MSFFGPNRKLRTVMAKFILDAETARSLAACEGQVWLCDPSGRSLGYFCPAADLSPLSEAERRGPFSDAELERRRQDRGGRPLDEILAAWERS